MIISICSFLLCSAFALGQVTEEETPFNQQTQQSIGIGFAITGFSANFTYFVSPHYAFRYHRHWFGLTPFYGRLDALTNQQDLGVGVDYRLYPFKNLGTTLLYFPVGFHFNYKWTSSSEQTAMFYKVGFGVEAILGKRFSLSLDTNLGLGQSLNSKTQSSEETLIYTPAKLRYYFSPIFRISYQL